VTKSERIAIVTTSYPTTVADPSGHFVETEARALARAGHQVTVFAGAASALTRSMGERLRVVWLADGGATGWPGLAARLKARPLRGFGLLRWSLAVRRELTRQGPFERVIGHWLLPTGFPTLLGLELGGAALELVVHGSDARLLAGLPAGLGGRIVRALLARGARVRCVSGELARVLERSAGQALHEQLRVEALPIDVSGAPTRARARLDLGIAADARLIVVVARLVSEKRTREALQAAALLTDAEVVVVGDGPELANLVREFPRVRFVGRLARARALAFIAAADALLSASRLEGAPTVVREARALGVPVVASVAGDLAAWALSDPELWVVA
jgi:glycosyltransferase involved in cell wall biosynthesis